MRKALIILLALLMAVVTKTIGSDAARDYSTISAWEADLDDTGIYASGDDAVGDCYNDSAFDESVTIDGGGTVGLNSVTLTVPSGERHDGTAGTGARLVSSADGSSGIAISTQPVTVKWLEIDWNNNAVPGTIGVDLSGDNDNTVSQCVLHDVTDAGAHQIVQFTRMGTDTPAHNLLNTIIYDGVFSGANDSYGVIDAIAASSRTTNILNVTVHNVANSGGGAGLGVSFSDNTPRSVRNVIATDSDTDFIPASPSNATVDHNLSSDATASGTGSLTNKASSDQFVSNTDPYDLHLKSGADCIDAGTDLGTTPTGVNIDIDGRDRDAEGDTWDIGADEFVAATTQISANVAQTLPAVIQTVSGAVDITGSASQTLASIIQSASVAVDVTGNVGQTLPFIQQNASGAVEVAGTVGQSLPALSQTATVSVGISGTAQQTLPTLTQSASSSVVVAGTVGQTLPALAQSASGSVEVSGTAGQTLPAMSQQASASIEGVTSATVSQTLPALSQQADASVTVTGQIAQQLPALNQTATTKTETRAQVDQTLPAISQSATATTETFASIDQTLAAMRQSATATVEVEGVGDQTLPAVTQAAQVGVGVSATLDQTLAAMVQSASTTGPTIDGPVRSANETLQKPGVAGETIAKPGVAGETLKKPGVSGEDIIK